MEKFDRYLLAYIGAAIAKTSVNDVLAQAEEYAKPATPVKAQNEPNWEDVDFLYRLYPSKTFRDGKVVTTGKCEKDKRRLATILKTRTRDDIEKVMRNYITECNGNFLKNFSTFLNNLPESEGTIFSPDDTNKYQDIR